MAIAYAPLEAIWIFQGLCVAHFFKIIDPIPIHITIIDLFINTICSTNF